jgi:outer membrane protein TolC
MDPYAFAPKNSSAFYQMPLDTTNVTENSLENPLTLSEILDIALRNNPSTKLTWAKARAAAAQWGQTESPLFPSLSANYTFERSKTTYPPEFGTPRFVQYLSDWGPGLSLSYLLFDFGQTRAAAQSARQALLFADFTHNRQIQTVLQQVTADYYTYLSQQEMLTAKEADLITAQTSLDAAQVGYDAGVKDLSDLLQAKTQFLQTKIQLAQQQQTLTDATASLLTDMGLFASQTVAIEPLPEVPPIDQMLATSDQLLTIALEKRADLMAAEAELKSQEYAVEAAWKQLWPTLTYNGTVFDGTSNPGGHLGLNWTSTFSVNFPLFSGFSVLNNLKQVKAQKVQAEATLRQTQLSVVEDVVTVHASTKTSFQTMQCSEALLTAAKEQYSVALARYKTGVGTILELLSAQSTLADARAQDVSTTNRWLNALVKLSYAAGTLMPPTHRKIQ